ncbi:MAG: roadblock/LC7 domain-containing protein [Actinocatenispora sp.]
MTELDLHQDNMGPLLVSLVDRVPGVSHAVIASVEGVPVAVSAGLPRQRAEQLASIGAGLLSIADGAGRCMDAGGPRQAVVEMAEGLLMATPVSSKLSLTVLAVADCERERLGYEIGEFTVQIPQLIR